MKLSIDTEADALSLWLKDGYLKHSKEVAPGIILGYDNDGNVASIGVLAVSRFLSGRRPPDLELDLTPDHSVVEYEVELPEEKRRALGI